MVFKKNLTLILTLRPLFIDGVQLSQSWSHLAVKNSMAPWEVLRLRIKRRIKINLYRPHHTLTRMKQKQKAIKIIKQIYTITNDLGCETVLKGFVYLFFLSLVVTSICIAYFLNILKNSLKIDLNKKLFKIKIKLLKI